MLFAFGLNHKTAPIEVREKLYITEAEIPEVACQTEGNSVGVYNFVYLQPHGNLWCVRFGERGFGFLQRPDYRIQKRAATLLKRNIFLRLFRAQRVSSFSKWRPALIRKSSATRRFFSS